MSTYTTIEIRIGGVSQELTAELTEAGQIIIGEDVSLAPALNEEMREEARAIIWEDKMAEHDIDNTRKRAMRMITMAERAGYTAWMKSTDGNSVMVSLPEKGFREFRSEFELSKWLNGDHRYANLTDAQYDRQHNLDLSDTDARHQWGKL